MNKQLVKSIKKIILSLLTINTLSSCSVVMAAKKEGVSLTQVQACRTRGQFLANGATLISSDRLVNGDLVEVYQFKKEKGSVARAFMHGLLDVGTCGLWEVVGTPIEAYSNDNGKFAIRVFYDHDENIKQIELL